jgi:hypothetical protein
MLCAECYEVAVVTGVLAGALLAGVLIGLVLVSEELAAAAAGLVLDSPLLVDSLPLDVVEATGVLGDEDLVRLSVL